MLGGKVHLWMLGSEISNQRSQIAEVLAHQAGTDPAALQFARGLNGKPRLAHPSNLRFNISHSRGRALVAIAFGREIGVDIQVIESGSRGLDGIAHFFSPRENALVREQTGDARPVTLAKLWTAKEAVLKATGEGITRSLKDLDVSAALADSSFVLRRAVVGETRMRRWTVLPLDVGPGYAGALAVEGAEPPAVVVRNWPPGAV